MRILIRPAGPDDFVVTEAIENRADALFAEQFGSTSWEPAPSGADRAADPGFTLVAVVESSGEVVGFVQVLEIGGHAHLEQISVLPEFGKQGIGGRLLEAAANEAQDRGHDRLSLRTFADLPWNAPFYSQHGFVPTEPETEFHRELVRKEVRAGLTAYGRRIQMTLELSRRAARRVGDLPL